MSNQFFQDDSNIFFRQIYVLLTHKCPLDCDYCYIDKSEKHQDMSWETLQYVMEKVRPQFKGGRGIVFFGGEPLLRVDLIEKAVLKYYESIPGGIGGVVTSACVNMDKFLPLYRDYHMDLQISFDGITHVKSRHKRFDFKGLSPYFELKDKRFQLRKTVSDSNIDTLFEDYLFGRKLHLEHGISFDFDIAHQKEFGVNFWNKLYSQKKKMWDFIYNTMSRGERTYIPQTLMMDIAHVAKFIGQEYPEQRLDSCEVGHILVIDWNGDCYPCTMLSQLGDSFKMGNIYTGIDVDKVKEYIKPMDCSCPYSVVCGGGCRWERYHAFGVNDIGKKLTSTCKMMHINYKTAMDFLDMLSGPQKLLINLSVERFMRYQKMTYNYGMYIQAHEIAKKSIKDIEGDNLISCW